MLEAFIKYLGSKLFKSYPQKRQRITILVNIIMHSLILRLLHLLNSKQFLFNLIVSVPGYFNSGR